MTEWDAPDYARISGLQKAMAEEVLGLLHFQGSERVLDVGCGDGRITAEIAARVPQGAVVGVDPSVEMISYAHSHWSADRDGKLRFEVGDARHLQFQDEFDVVVSFNALHWIPEQEQALDSIRRALKPGGIAQLRLVPRGPRKSIEDVLRETWQSPRWEAFFRGFHHPYLHLAPEEYAELAQRARLKVERVHVADKSWDFHSRVGFISFSEVTMVAWTHVLADADKPAFINDVLDRYATVAGDDRTFKFYQMDVRLARS